MEVKYIDLSDEIYPISLEASRSAERYLPDNVVFMGKPTAVIHTVVHNKIAYMLYYVAKGV